MNAFKWFSAALKKYFDFTGRARRKEYWYFVLFNLLIIVLISIIETTYKLTSIEVGFGQHIGLISGIYMLLMLPPTLAATTRRLHDTGRSGWWQLFNLLPIVGSIVVLICTVEDSQPGANQYGKNPRGKCLIINY